MKNINMPLLIGMTNWVYNCYKPLYSSLIYFINILSKENMRLLLG